MTNNTQTEVEPVEDDEPAQPEDETGKTANEPGE